MKHVDVIEVRIWGRRVGAVALEPSLGYYAFAFDPSWRRTGIELAPLTMPLDEPRPVFVFPNLSDATFLRLPGMLADAMPDDFGNALIDAWMAQRGVAKREVTALDRLAYMGKRGMGALEFRPSRGSHSKSAEPLELKSLVESARKLLKGNLDTRVQPSLTDLIRVGTSAGGARAKAVIAWNSRTNAIRSGQFDAAAGFEHWTSFKFKTKFS